MANGPTTPELVAAVSEAGAFGSLAGASLAPDALRDAIREVRTRTARPFAVNVFAPLPLPRVSREILDAVAQFRERLGLGALPEPAPRAWSVDDQLAVLADEQVSIVSFTFGIPPLDGLGDAILLGTATTAAEARALDAAGVDVIVAQGAEAGGHRGTFLGSFEDGLVPLPELLPQVVAATGRPVVAAGAIMDGADVAAALEAGAAGAQLGTAFLFCPESGASQAWRDALRADATVVSARYTGRAARGARTPFVAELEASGLEPAPYPLQGQLFADLRERDGYGWYLGGTGAARARELPAGELVRTLVAELGAR
jgi:nitronate monooxygenase